MKKLMIAFAAIAVAVCAQAAQCTWASGAFYTASGSNGGWSTTMFGTTTPVITMSLYYVDSDTYASLSTKSQSDLYDWSLKQTASATAENKTTAGVKISAATIKDTSVSASTTYYAVLTATYTDATYGDMYMAAVKSATVTAQGAGTASNIFGGASTAAQGGVRNWQAVPEPTSGLLLLLGMAGLALRRRRA